MSKDEFLKAFNEMHRKLNIVGANITMRMPIEGQINKETREGIYVNISIGLSSTTFFFGQNPSDNEPICEVVG